MSQLSVVSGPLQEKLLAYRVELKADDEMIITRYVLFPWRFSVNEVNPQRTTDNRQRTPPDFSRKSTEVLLQQTVNKRMVVLLG